MTKSNRHGPIHPEAPERGLCVGKEGRRVINLAGPGCPGCVVPHWVCSGGPLHQLPPAQCAKKAPPKEKCVGGEEEQHFTLL